MLRIPFILLWNFLHFLWDLLFLPFKFFFKIIIQPSENSYLHVIIHRTVHLWEPSWKIWELFQDEEEEDLNFQNWQKIVDLLKKSPKVKGIILEIKELELSLTSVEQLRNILASLREVDKEIVLYLHQLGIAELYLASVASKIILSPAAHVFLTMPAAQMFFLGEFFEKLGIKPSLYSIGEYKTAPEMFTRSFPSLQNREDIQRTLKEYKELLFAGFIERTELQREELEAALTKGIFTVEDVLQYRLVDAIRYFPRVMDYLLDDDPQPLDPLEMPHFAHPTPTFIPQLEGFSHPYLLDTPQKAAESEEEKPKKQEEEEGEDEDEYFIDFSDLESLSAPYFHWTSLRRKQYIAVIPVIGTIKSSSSKKFDASEEALSGPIVESLKKVKANKKVKGVIVFVDSRGGEGDASEEIWWAIKDLKKEKPVIAFMNSYAASGGYYVASAAEQIIASPWTITGSIGVFGGKFVIEELVKKFKVYPTTFEETPGTRLLSPLAIPSKEEERRIEEQLALFYWRFLARVAESRKMDLEAVHELAQGKVYSGREALKLRLVDECGDFFQAVEKIKELAKVPQARLKFVEQKENILASLSSALNPLSRASVSLLAERSFSSPLFQEFAALDAEQRFLLEALDRMVPIAWLPPLSFFPRSPRF